MTPTLFRCFLPLPFMIAPAAISTAHGLVTPVELDTPCDSTVAGRDDPRGLVGGRDRTLRRRCRNPTCPFFARGGYGRAMGALHPPSFARLCLHHKPGPSTGRQSHPLLACVGGRVHDSLAEGNMTKYCSSGPGASSPPRCDVPDRLPAQQSLRGDTNDHWSDSIVALSGHEGCGRTCSGPTSTLYERPQFD